MHLACRMLCVVLPETVQRAKGWDGKEGQGSDDRATADAVLFRDVHPCRLVLLFR